MLSEEIAKKLESVENSIQTYFNKAHGLKDEIQKLNTRREATVSKVASNKARVAEAVHEAVMKAEASLSESM